jgi:hypothetical protein
VKIANQLVKFAQFRIQNLFINKLFRFFLIFLCRFFLHFFVILFIIFVFLIFLLFFILILRLWLFDLLTGIFLTVFRFSLRNLWLFFVFRRFRVFHQFFFVFLLLLFTFQEKHFVWVELFLFVLIFITKVNVLVDTFFDIFFIFFLLPFWLCILLGLLFCEFSRVFHMFHFFGLQLKKYFTPSIFIMI